MSRGPRLPLLFAGLLLVAAAAAAGEPSPEKRPLSSADKHMSDVPDGPGREAYMNGLGLMMAGFFEPAAAKFEEAIAAEPERARFHSTLAAMLMQKEENLPRAEFAALRGLEHAPEHASLWINLGIIRMRRGNLEGAQPALEKGLALDPESGEGHAWLARVHWRKAQAVQPIDQDELGLAIAEMLSASVYQPDSPVVHFQLGMMLEQSGNLEAALASYRTAHELRPDHPQGIQKVEELEAALAQRGEP